MSKRLLSVNENRPMNYLLQTMLFTKYWLICVHDVLSAMHEIRYSKPIDLIIIDLDYQKQENLDFIEHIKTSSLYNVPLIALVSPANKPLIETLSLQTSIDKFFIKPFNPLDLCSSVDTLLLSEIIQNT